MEELLKKIQNELVAKGLEIERYEWLTGITRWDVTSPADEVAVRVFIYENFNGYPEFLCECPTSSSTAHVTPIHSIIGDMRDHIVSTHVPR